MRLIEGVCYWLPQRDRRCDSAISDRYRLIIARFRCTAARKGGVRGMGGEGGQEKLGRYLIVRERRRHRNAIVEAFPRR